MWYKLSTVQEQGTSIPAGYLTETTTEMTVRQPTKQLLIQNLPYIVTLWLKCRGISAT